MKPQKIAPKFPGTVRQLFFKKIRGQFLNPQFQTDVVKPLRIDDIIDQEVQHLSAGIPNAKTMATLCNSPPDNCFSRKLEDNS